jgi:hypothetical protein
MTRQVIEKAFHDAIEANDRAALEALAAEAMIDSQKLRLTQNDLVVIRTALHAITYYALFVRTGKTATRRARRWRQRGNESCPSPWNRS